MARKRKPGSQSAGYHYPAAIPDYKPKTPTVAPSPSEAAKGPAGDYAGAGKDYEAAVTALPPKAQAVTEAATERATAAREAKRAEQQAATRQKHLVNKYVTKAFDNKVSTIKGSTGPVWQVGQRVEKAKSEVESLREQLLSHPAVKDANSEGKVVPPKGLAKLGPTPLERGTAAFHLELPGPQRGAREAEKERLFKQRLLPLFSEQEKRSTPKVATAGTPGKSTGESWSPGNALAMAVERDVVDPAKQAGVLPKSKTFGQKAYQRIAEYAPLAISLGPEVSAGAKAANLALRGAEVGGERIAGSALSRLLKPAATVDSQAAKSAVAASKAEPAATGIKRIADVVTRAGPRSERALARKLTGTQTRREAAHAGGLPLLGFKAGTPQGSALIEGQVAALKKDPGKVLSSTASLAPSLLTSAFMFPVAFGTTGGRAALSATGVKHYTPEQITAPTTGAVEAQQDFVKHFVNTYVSGDAKKVEEATLKEGLLPEVLAAPLLAKAGKHVYGPLRDKARESVAARRAPLTDAQGNVLLHEHGGPVKRGTQRFPTKEPAPISRRGEQHAMRREEAFHAATVNDQVQLEVARRRAEMDKHARKAAGEQTPVREGLGKKGKDTLHQRPPDYIPFLARAGIDLHNPEAALREIKHYEKTFAGLDRPSKYGVNPEALTARDAVKFFAENPDALKNPDLAKAVEAFRSQQNGETGFRSLGFSERNQYLAPAVMHDIPLPETRVPMAARDHTAATTREGAWSDLKSRQKKAEAIRKEGRKKYDQAEAFDKTSEKGKALRAEGKARYEEARRLNADAKELHSALKPFTRPGAKLSTAAKRMHYDKALEKEFADEVRAKLKERGLHTAPAYVPDQAAISKGTPDQSVTGGQKPLPGGPKINSGYVWRHGLSRQGYEHLVNEGITRQVVRNHQFEDFRRFRAERGIPFEGKYQHNGKGWGRAFEQGVMNRKDVVLVPKQVVNRLEKATQGGDPTEYEAALAQMQAARKLSPDDAQPGTLYEAFPKAAYAEKIAQVGRSNVPEAVRKMNRYTSQAMLSTPAFVAAQVAAEGAQMFAEVGNPVRLIQGLKEYSRLTPEQKMRISGASGETAKAIFSPEDLQTTLGSYDAKPFKDSLSFFRRNVFGRSAKSFVMQRAAGELNRMTSSVTRRATLTGAVMRDMNGMWAKGRKLLDFQTDLQKRIEKSGKRPLEYLAENPRQLDIYQKKLHDAQGGWSNYTRTGLIPESTRGAALVFYGYLRMSVQWPLKYALNHPIKATALSYLAAQNNWALRETLHGEPSFLNYAQVPVYGVGKDGKPATINLSRISPGGNALTQAIQGSNSVLGAFQPVPTAIFQGLTGQGPLGAVEGGVPAHLKAATASVLALSPWLRAADTLAGQKRSGEGQYGILAERANLAVEPLSALFAKLKGSKSSQLERSLGFPFIPQDVEKQRDLSKVGEILGNLSKYGSDSQAKVEARSRADEPKVRKQVIAMQKKYGKAHDELQAMYKKHGLEKVAKRSEEIYYYTHPFPGSTESKGGYSTGGYESSGYESGGYGGAEEKPPAFPKQTNGFNLPGLGGLPLGDIGNTLGALIGGEAAQAATVPKGRKGVALTGPLSAGEKTFAKTVAKETTLKPETVAAWTLQEGGNSTGDYNRLNIGHTDSGPLGLTADPRWKDPVAAGKLTAEFLKGRFGGASEGIQAILPAAKGKSASQQLQIIANSGWATDPAYAEHLQGTLASVGVSRSDLHRSGNKVYVRADAKGMVKWAHALLGTQEGSKLQVKWAAQSGVSSAEPWCSEFIAAGLARRGLPQPANPAYSGTWLTWKGGKHIGTDLAKAKPGDVVVFGSNPGATTHVGLYVGSGKMISGNWSDEVAAANVSDDSEPIAGIIRPKYKGGKVAVKAGTPLPGSAIAPGGELISAPVSVPPVTATKTSKSQGRERQPTPAERLKLVNEITSGNFAGLGIPGYEPSVGPSVADLQRLGASLEEDRRKLARL